MKSLKTILVVFLVLVLAATMMVGCSEKPYPSKSIDVVCQVALVPVEMCCCA